MPAVKRREFTSYKISIMYYTNLYHKAYSEIGALTPISADCGKLCGSRCCKGDQEAGMIVFPGEETLLRSHGFSLLPRQMNGYPVSFAICTGRCRRIFRPLACRIFPLAPFFDNHTLFVAEDPRAQALCPLLSAHAVEQPFYDAVYRAFCVLTEDFAICEMLTHYTSMLNEYRVFWNI